MKIHDFFKEKNPNKEIFQSGWGKRGSVIRGP